MWQQPGGVKSPALSRHSEPRGWCALPWVWQILRLGRGTPTSDPWGSHNPATYASSHSLLPPSRNGSACNHGRLLSLAAEDCSIGPLEGDEAWELGLVAKATGWSP